MPVVAGAAGGGALIILLVIILVLVLVAVVCYRRHGKKAKVHLTYDLPSEDSPSSVKKLPMGSGLDPEVSMSITESGVVRYLNTENGGGPTTRNGSVIINGGSSTFGK